MIKEAVEKMFPKAAKVASVNTMNLDGKKKRRGMIVGKTAKTKKAIVKLTADSADIEIFSWTVKSDPLKSCTAKYDNRSQVSDGKTPLDVERQA